MNDSRPFYLLCEYKHNDRNFQQYITSHISVIPIQEILVKTTTLYPGLEDKFSHMDHISNFLKNIKKKD